MQSQKHHRWRRRFTVALFLAFAVPLACGFGGDEFSCEDAVARLQSCCPGFDPTQVDCTFSASNQGCNSYPVYPELDEAQSTCIRNESCEALRNNGVCERAEKLPTPTEWQDDAQLTSPDAGPVEDLTPVVCP
jgi:hypothetical protein